MTTTTPTPRNAASLMRSPKLLLSSPYHRQPCSLGVDRLQRTLVLKAQHDGQLSSLQRHMHSEASAACTSTVSIAALRSERGRMHPRVYYFARSIFNNIIIVPGLIYTVIIIPIPRVFTVSYNTAPPCVLDPLRVLPTRTIRRHEYLYSIITSSNYTDSNLYLLSTTYTRFAQHAPLMLPPRQTLLIHSIFMYIPRSYYTTCTMYIVQYGRAHIKK